MEVWYEVLYYHSAIDNHFTNVEGRSVAKHLR